MRIETEKDPYAVQIPVPAEYVRQTAEYLRRYFAGFNKELLVADDFSYQRQNIAMTTGASPLKDKGLAASAISVYKSATLPSLAKRRGGVAAE